MSLEADLAKLGIHLPAEQLVDATEGEITLAAIRDVMDAAFYKRKSFEIEDAVEVKLMLEIHANRLAHKLAEKGVGAVTSDSHVMPLRERDTYTFAGVTHRGPCKHVRVDANIEADRLKCHDCGKGVNPMWWLASYAVTIARGYEALHHARQEARALAAEVAELKKERATHKAALRRHDKKRNGG